MNNFSSFLLSPVITQNLNDLGYESATQIQLEAIGHILEGRDVLGISQTGTGKTAAFCLPILQALLAHQSKAIRAIVIAPTRELVSQIHESFEKYGKGTGIRIASIYGGVDQKIQIASLKLGADIVVATPGRLLDLMHQGHIRLGKVEIFVLDEADRMLDMGFSLEIDEIIEALPLKKQALFFSATMMGNVSKLANKILSNPVKIEVSPQSSVSLSIKQKVIFCKREEKFQLLRQTIKDAGTSLILVFTKTKNSADRIKEYLRSHRMACALFHGDRSQEDRERAIHHFKSGSIKILIATDIASRGIDVEDVGLVINFELPLGAENYVHRVGRTARAGKKGIAVTFCDDSEKSILERIEILIKMKIPSEHFSGHPEASGKWLEKGIVRRITPPTPGKSQDKAAYLDHSKRQKLVTEGGPKAKAHPGFKKKKKK